MNTDVKLYYDQIAAEYDHSRFDNSYGRFIHVQESKILNHYLAAKQGARSLDLACGTGRFLNFTSHGVDISEAMLALAQEKYPAVDLQQAPADDLPFEHQFFDYVLSFHLMMHLDAQQFADIQKEVARVVKTDGLFIFDIPSKKRRQASNYKAASWHAGHQASVAEIQSCISDDWELVNYHGVAFFPLHRIPKKARRSLLSLDTFLCNSWVKEYASHLIFILKKK